MLYVRSSAGSQFAHHFYVAPPDEIANVVVPSITLGRGDIPASDISDFSLSEELIVGTNWGGHILVIHGATGAEMQGEMQYLPGYAILPLAVGADVLFEHFGDVGTLQRTAFGEVPTILLESDDADYAALHVDLQARTMTWVRTEAMDVPGSGRLATRSDVYTSPLSTTPEGIEARYVANVFPEVSDEPVSARRSKAGSGFFLNWMRTVYVRLSDGERFMMPPDSGANISLFQGTFWLADGWQYTGVGNGFSSDGRGLTLMRQRLDTLVPYAP